MLDEAAQANAAWEQANDEYQFLCQECMAPLADVVDFVGDEEDVPDDHILAAFPGEKSKNELLKQEANTKRHHWNHEPKNPFCPGCQGAKAQRRRRPSRRRSESEKKDRPKLAPGQEVTMDPVMENDPRMQGLSHGEKRVKGGLFIYDKGIDLS